MVTQWEWPGQGLGQIEAPCPPPDCVCRGSENQPAQTLPLADYLPAVAAAGCGGIEPVHPIATMSCPLRAGAQR